MPMQDKNYDYAELLPHGFSTRCSALLASARFFIEVMAAEACTDEYKQHLADLMQECDSLLEATHSAGLMVIRHATPEPAEPGTNPRKDVW